MEIKKWIEENLLTKSNDLNPQKLKEKWFVDHNQQDILEVIYNKTNFLTNVPLKERVYCIINEIDDVVICLNEQCKNYTNFYCFKIGYNKHCSHKCSNSSKEVQRKKAQTCQKNFGVASPAQSKTVQAKMQETCMDCHLCL